MTQASQDFSASYRRFEDKFRGSQETITSRLKAYIPMLEAVEQRRDKRVALDLGMGRGEWLRLLKNRGWTVFGVDQNKDMIASSGLPDGALAVDDVLLHLKQCPSESYDLVTAFHVVEHLEHAYLRELISETYRVLTPGGVVLFETPNPENLSVASWAFLMDSTHLRALPSSLLSFVLDDAGFHQPLIFRLNGRLPDNPGRLEEILANLFLSAPDYAVLAEKQPEISHVSHWREKLTASSQPRPSDMHRLLMLARGLDEMLQNSHWKIEQGVTEQISQLRSLGEQLVELDVQRRLALEAEIRKDREINELRIRELSMAMNNKISLLRDEMELENWKRNSSEQAASNFDLSFRDARSASDQELIPNRLSRRWRRLKNSIKKRLPQTVREKGARRWNKLQRSISKLLRSRPVDQQPRHIVTHPAPFSPRTKGQTISKLEDVISGREIKE